MSEVKQSAAEGAAGQVADPLVAFRFGIPSLPIGHVGRPRLLNLLERGADQSLTLVSAAAGTGKTSLVADWASRRDPEATAWITFEHGDEHASAFWSSVFAQLHMHGVAAAGTKLPPNATEVPRPLLAEMASTLAGRDEALALVMDGWEFTTDDVADPFDFLLRHSHGKLGAVIVTRSDPVLPLHRYRLNDQMTEVRSADLAFTPDEVRALVGASGLTLTEQSVAGLATRTRGWAAGLRFATIYLLGQPDPDAAVLQLAGDTGNIAEYLVAEVLEMQSDADRELLLNTCIVEILRPGLIEELGGPTAPRGLAQLAHANALVETVADHAGWYRYHPFFRDLLRAELNYLAPARAIALHRRAGRWLANEGMLGAAVSHAAAAFQWAEAAQYIVDDLAVGSIFQGCEQQGLSSTMRAMPEGVQGPAAGIVRAAVAVSRGDTAAAALDLQRAQQSTGGGRDSSGPDHRAQRLANGLIASLLSLNDADAVAALYASSAAAKEVEGQVLDRLAAHPELAAMITAARATAMVRSGRLRAARTAFAAAVDVAEQPGCESTLVYCLSHLAVLDAVDGGLRGATAQAERALGLATRAGVDGCGLQATGLVALSWVALQQGDAATARKRIADVLAHGGLEVVLPASLLELATARLARLDGDTDRAMEIVRGVRESVAMSAPWVADLCVEDEVATALSGGGASVTDELVTALSARDDTGAQLTAARLQLRQGIAGAADAVGPIVGRRAAPLVAQVTAALLVAEAEIQRGDAARARASVQHACRLAASEGLRWPFQDAPPEVRDLVARHHAASIDRTQGTAVDGNRATSARAIPRPRDRDASLPNGDSPAPLIDALTVKELEVLNHLSELLTTEEIADAMFVSVNTVRTHVRSILRKLSVSRRHQAVRRARALDILSS